jgi:hypothetical protein
MIVLLKLASATNFPCNSIADGSEEKHLFRKFISTFTASSFSKRPLSSTKTLVLWMKGAGLTQQPLSRSRGTIAQHTHKQA